MYYYRLTFACGCLAALCLGAPAAAQSTSGAAPATPADPSTPDQPAAPALRRWLDVQSILAATRYRWTENSAGRVTTSAVQWQTQLRARFLFDQAGRYHIGSFVTTGPTFRSGWNNTGAGLGRLTHPFKVRHLYFSAEPAKGLEVQAGGLAVNRGELGDTIASDNDSFIVGGRVAARPSQRRITQLSITAAHFDAVGVPNLFKQLDDIAELNYGQALIGFRIGARTTASVDYTYEDGRDILRQGVTIRMPSPIKLLTQVKLESYQRLAPDRDAGVNTSIDLRAKKLTATLGLMSADRDYGPFNGDRYESGRRYYYTVNYPITAALVLQLFHTKAFEIDFPVAIAQRMDLVVTYNPTAALRRAGVF